MPEISPAEWDQFLSHHPEAHILQTTAWGELKRAFGWQVIRLQQGNTGAQVLMRQLFPGIRLAYIPKGPVGNDLSKILPDIDRLCRKFHCVFLKLELDAWEETYPGPSQPPRGFLPSSHSIQPPRTLLVDLRGDEQAVLGQMKHKTRYNINLAIKKGVITRPTIDLDIFHSLIELTAQRDRFGAHQLGYYRRAYELFHPLGQCELFLAEYEHEPLAALMVFAYGKRAWYFYGGSANVHRERMPNYLLQWEAMRWARNFGCEEYDLWGVPDADLNTLEDGFTDRYDGLWGVYRFKRGFGGVLHRAVGPWDRVYRPLLYRLYLLWQKGHRTE
jgi:lipid II:glycine glycyltransferase (peptidoglycan interpeptide bridge formation enzyme)